MDFKTIAFTSPESVENENMKICSLLNSSAIDIFHIRKPTYTDEQIAYLIESIPEELHPRLRLHSAFWLKKRFNIGGIHLNQRHPEPINNISVSKSVHSLKELEESEELGFEYVTLSPIFNSISKQGYKSGFDIEDTFFTNCIKEFWIKGIKIIALGGVEPKDMPDLKSAGFAGAAFLGYIWNLKIPFSNIIDNILISKKLCCNI